MNPPSAPLKRAAYIWGTWVARYFRWAVPFQNITIHGQRPNSPSIIWITWHSANLLGLVSYARMPWAHACQSFISSGWTGLVAQGWVEATGLTAARLPPEGTGNPRAAMKQMVNALRQNMDVVVAVDGPHGPANVVKPGALWLARLTGCPIVPVGAAAQPVWRLPRWDKQQVPLPGARLRLVFAPPLYVARGEEIDDALCTKTAQILNEAMQEAQVRLNG
ncbi:MAG: DUF374 domain-containing protein [Anaerolineales bacterium]|nr:DUF374 domain-containing protein [Anaerolineales bacterium]